jgi:hypothetical protein
MKISVCVQKPLTFYKTALLFQAVASLLLFPVILLIDLTFFSEGEVVRDAIRNTASGYLFIAVLSCGGVMVLAAIGLCFLCFLGSGPVLKSVFYVFMAILNLVAMPLVSYMLVLPFLHWPRGLSFTP